MSATPTSPPAAPAASRAPALDWQPLDRVLAQTVRYARALALAAGLLRLLIAAGATALAALAADALWPLSGGARLAVALGYAALVLGLAGWWVLRPALARWSPERAARHLETVHPEFDNRCINAVQLRAAPLDGFGRLFLRAIARELAPRTAALSVRRTFALGPLRALGLALAAVAVLALAYRFAWPEAFSTSLARYLHPRAEIAAWSRTQVTVQPEGATLGRGESLTVSAEVAGALPEGATLETRTGDEAPRRSAMSFERGAFRAVQERVERGFLYRVAAGDAQSPWYELRVIERAAVAALDVTTHFPAYTGLAPETAAGPPRALEVPAGSRLLLAAKPTRPTRRVALYADDQLVAAGTRDLHAALAPERDLRLHFELLDAEGFAGAPPAPFPLRVRPDQPPTVAITAPRKDVAIDTPRPFAVNVRAEDDWSLRELALWLAHGDGPERRLEARTPDPGTRAWTGGFVLPLETMDLHVGDVLRYRVTAGDGHPDRPAPASSRVYEIRLVSAAQQSRDTVNSLLALRRRLRDLIRRQERLIDDTRDWQRTVAVPAAGNGAVPGGRRAGRSSATPEALAADQRGIRDEVAMLADLAGEETPTERQFGAALLRVLAGELAAAVKACERLGTVAAAAAGVARPPSAGHGTPPGAAAPLPSPPGLAAAGEEALAAEQAALEALRALLGETQGTVQAIKRGQDPAAPGAAHDDREKDAADLRHRLDEELARFVAEQREILDASRELEGRPVDDFTEAERKKLEDLAIWESKWSAFFQDLLDDISQLPEQDFSDSSMRKELVEIYEEVEKAADALTARNIEIAVPAEQAGLEAAETLEHNLERWLPTTHDNLEWSMEDPPDDQEIPLVDLPEELEDIIGDLLDDENDLESKAEDVTSQWMDSIDEGAGWDALDGPISNMSARGVTGNQLPNESEIGGRSGEGRTGRSSGQFVEQEATGKGGRQTPTRTTPDPYETGEVKDSSTDPQGGATGGGKVSGLGGEGLRGPIPPPLRQEFRRLAGQQALLRQQTERLRYELRKRRYPEHRMDEAVDLMKDMERDLFLGRTEDFSRRKAELAGVLDTQRQLTAAQMTADREEAAKIHRPLREALHRAQTDVRPASFAGEIEEYYRRLARGAAER